MRAWTIEAEYDLLEASKDGLEEITRGLAMVGMYMINCTLLRNIRQNPRHVKDGFLATRTALLRNLPDMPDNMDTIMPIPLGPACIFLQRFAGLSMAFLTAR